MSERAAFARSHHGAGLTDAFVTTALRGPAARGITPLDRRAAHPAAHAARGSCDALPLAFTKPIFPHSANRAEARLRSTPSACCSFRDARCVAAIVGALAGRAEDTCIRARRLSRGAFGAPIRDSCGGARSTDSPSSTLTRGFPRALSRARHRLRPAHTALALIARSGTALAFARALCVDPNARGAAEALDHSARPAGNVLGHSGRIAWQSDRSVLCCHRCIDGRIDRKAPVDAPIACVAGGEQHHSAKYS